MNNKYDLDKLNFAVLKDDGTYGEPMVWVLKPTNSEELYKESSHKVT